jgi:hypothetical protein
MRILTGGATMYKLACAAIIALAMLFSPTATTPASASPVATASSPIFGKAQIVPLTTDQNKKVTGKYAGSPYAYYGYLYSYYSYVYNLYHYYYGSSYAYSAYIYAYYGYIYSYYAYLGY